MQAKKSDGAQKVEVFLDRVTSSPLVRSSYVDVIKLRSAATYSVNSLTRVGTTGATAPRWLKSAGVSQSGATTFFSGPICLCHAERSIWTTNAECRQRVLSRSALSLH